MGISRKRKKEFVEAFEKFMNDNKDVLGGAPGQFLLAAIDDTGLNQVAVAKRGSIDARRVSALIHEGKTFTVETSLKLQSALGVKAELWAMLSVFEQIRLRREEMRAVLEG